MGEGPGGVAAVTVAFRGGLADLDGAEDALAYALARRHGRCPMDRGRALGTRLRRLQALHGGLAPAVAALCAEEGFRWAPAGDAAIADVAAGCRLAPGVAAALEALRVPVIALADTEPEIVETALRPLDGAFAAVVGAGLPAALRRAGAPAARVIHVCAGEPGRRDAESLGMPVARSLAELVRPHARTLAVAAGG